MNTTTDDLSERVITIDLAQQQGYRFEVRFDDPAVPVLLTDEPPPLGAGAGPDPARLLAAAVSNCLAASLLFALRKLGNHAEPLRAHATLRLGRNERNRLRVSRIAVDLNLGARAQDLRMLPRVLAQFEDYCIVTQSVRAGFTVDVQVFDRDGTPLHATTTSPEAQPA
ncbi:MAG TPA: OsmC family protein [Caldimonas sp.]|jgi:uncharacterized OsmC-like protein